MYSSNSTFPSLQPNRKKDKAFHEECANLIISRSMGKSMDAEVAAIQGLYDLFDGAYDIERFKYLMDDGAGNGGTLPAVWQNINKVRPKIKVLIGELMERGYDFQVKAINKDAKSRFLEAKEQMRVDMRISPVFQQLSEYSGLPDDQGELPEDEEDLDEFFDKNYKEEAEVVMYYALKYLDKRNKWGVKRMELFRDMLISGKAIVKNEIFQGLPRPRRVDPRFFIHDTWVDGDMLEDATYFGELRYVNVAEAAEEFGLTKEEIEQAYAKYQDYLSPTRNGRQQHNFQFFESNKSATNKWFKETPQGLRILVAYACWVDYKKIKHRISEDKYGTEHLKRVSDATADKEDIVSKNIKIWRQATIIGGCIVKNWGEIPNQTRDLDNLAETEPPYTVLIPDFLNGRSVSLAEQLQGLQYLKDIITYQIQLAMARAGAKGFVYDTAQLPDGWEVETAIKYLKTVGIAFINSKQGGTPVQFNQFQQIDLTLSQSVGQYLDLSRWIDSEMDAMTGINEARQGVMQGASQAVGVTRSALLQSSLTTAPFFKLFDEFSSKVWNTQAKLVKIAWAEKERFSPIIGDVGVDFLKNDIDLDLNDYGVFIQVTPKLVDDIQSFQSILMAGLQSGQVSLEDTLTLLLETDVVSGIRRFEKIMAEKRQEEKQQELLMQQQQQQGQLMAQQQMGEFNRMTSEQAAQRAQQTQMIKNQGDMSKILAELRGKLLLEKVKTSGE